MFGASMLVVLFIREPQLLTGDDAPGERSRTSLAASFRELRGNLKDVFAGEKSLLFVLLGVLFWFMGFNAIETFFTSYGRFYLGIEESTAALILGFFSVTFMVTSVVSGLLAARIGRRRTIRIGIAIVAVILVVSLFLRKFGPLAGVFVVGGFGWALINVNSLPMVVDMTTVEKVGGYTGLYYFSSQAANIVAPWAAGLLIDVFGYPALMVFSAAMFAVSFIMMSFVRRGEATPAVEV
jgi:MFS-type transporter involved in bile tolerance (Atg22 family)